MSRSKSNKSTHRDAPPAELQSIDPTALANVSGGAARASAGSDNSEIMAALTGVLDSLNSLAKQPQAGFGPTEMMMFMMMLGGGGQSAPAVVQSPPGTIGGYAGYTIDGVYYPFK